MSDERFLVDLNKSTVWYGEKVQKVRDLFSRKEQKVTSRDTEFFTQYWQVFAWSAIIGFLNNKSIPNADLKNKTSIPSFKTIHSNGEDIAQALILMAIGKMKVDIPNDILKPRKVLNIIGEYAEGGAQHVLEMRETEGNENLFDHPDDYLMEIYHRTEKK